MLKRAIARAARDAIGARLLRTGPIARRAAATVSGVGIAYPREPGAHRLAGTRAPDIRLDGGSRLYEALRAGRFIVVRPPERPLRTVEAWGDRVHTVTSAEPGQTLMLVRPDGYIAWATDQTDPGHLDDRICTALADWCGAPTVPAPAQKE
jgi:hypothetical protein